MLAFIIVLALLVVAGFVVIAPFVLINKTNDLEDGNKRLRERLYELQSRIEKVETELKAARPPEAPPATAPVVEQLLDLRSEKREPAPAPATPPPQPTPVIRPAPPVITVNESFASVATPVVVPVPPAKPEEPAQPAELPEVAPAFNFEQFLGVKLFAWVGGLVLFLAVAFFIKYSFDHNLISPLMRVTGGYVLGLGLIVGGLKLPRERYAVTVQTLCAAGVLILYADFYAAHAFYKLLPNVFVTFALMAMVTAAAFLLAVRLNTQVVAVLGLLGGFLTPVVLSTGHDLPLGLFGYLFLLDAGLMAVAWRKRWPHLVLFAAVATIAMQFAWVNKFFAVEKDLAAMTIFVTFAVMFLVPFMLALRRSTKEADEVEPWTTAAAMLMPAAGMLFSLFLLVRPYNEIAAHPVKLFAYVFLLDLIWLTISWTRARLGALQLLAGGAVFLQLAVWTGEFLTAAHLNHALVLYLVFAVLHSAFPLVLQRYRPGHSPAWWTHLFPAFALVLVMFPIFKLETPSFLVWPVILVIDSLALLLAVLTASLASVVAVLILTSLATLFWIFQVPVGMDGTLGLPGMLTVIGGFALLFFFGSFVVEKLLIPAEAEGESDGAELAANRKLATHISSSAALLPFLLLIMVVLRLPLGNPSPVFGLAGLLVVMLLGLVRTFKLDALTPVALGSTLLLELVWHLRHFSGNGTAPDWLPLTCYAGFAFAFMLFPFACHRRVEERTAPWVTAALSLPLHFTLIYWVCQANLPDHPWPGLIPAVFVMPSLAGLAWVLNRIGKDNPARNTLLALFGGVTLFFITLIFPIQYEKEWLTMAWALEGVALLWLFHRVPHPGLRAVGVGLLCAAFVRLAINPAVFDYHPRSDTRIFNWFLYTYGIVTACLFAGARLLHPPREKVDHLNVLPLLYTLGTVLAFLLVNIEIADYFSEGATLTFKFSGNLARDMTYSLAWAIFAFILLVVGFGSRVAGARRAGMGLMVITVVKLFCHDLWSLGGLYRVGALIGLAIVLILASFIYQRVLALEKQRNDELKTA